MCRAVGTCWPFKFKCWASISVTRLDPNSESETQTQFLCRTWLKCILPENNFVYLDDNSFLYVGQALSSCFCTFLCGLLKMQQEEDSRASSGSQRDAFSSLVLPLLYSSVIIHTRVLLYSLAFSEVDHCASVYELMTPSEPHPPGNLLSMLGQEHS